MERPQLSASAVVIFYILMVAAAWFLGGYLADLDLLVWHNRNGTGTYLEVGLGVGLGVGVVVLSQLLEGWAEWARALSREFGRILGKISLSEAFIFAAASGIGEEIFFRGFVQQILSTAVFSGTGGDWLAIAVASLVFGGMHIGPDLETFWPWTVMAIVLGVGFGWMYLYTGNLLAPIIAHFTINFFNLYSIGQRYGHLNQQS